jgi:hypothetical protein
VLITSSLPHTIMTEVRVALQGNDGRLGCIHTSIHIHAPARSYISQHMRTHARLLTHTYPYNPYKCDGHSEPAAPRGSLSSFLSFCPYSILTPFSSPSLSDPSVSIHVYRTPHHAPHHTPHHTPHYTPYHTQHRTLHRLSLPLAGIQGRFSPQG